MIERNKDRLLELAIKELYGVERNEMIPIGYYGLSTEEQIEIVELLEQYEKHD